MQKTNVQFSPHEMELLTDPAWILTKNRVIQKMAEGMGSLAARMKKAVAINCDRLPQKLRESNAKLARGENYQGLPYLMLDYPRLFGKDNIIAIRTFFWWGHFCSITLHVKGLYQEPLDNNMAYAKSVLAQNKFYYSTDGDEWNHDVTSSDYTPIENFPLSQTPTNSAFIKLAAKVDLEQWSEMEEKLFEKFEVLMKLVLS